MKNDHLPVVLLALCLVFLAWHFLHSHRIKVLHQAINAPSRFYRPLPESDIPTWHLAYSNGFEGPYGVVKRESNRLTATYRIDYSTNIGQ